MKRFLRQFAFVLVPKLLSGLGSAGIGLVLMRYLEPAPFGALTLCLSTILLADGVLGSAFDLAAVRLASACAGEAQAGQLQRACLLLKLLALSLGAGAVLVSHDYILKTFFKEQASPALLVYTGLAVTAVLLLRSAQLSYQLSQQFRHYGLLDLMVNGLKCCGVAVLIELHQVDVHRVLLVFLMAPGLVLAGWALTHGRALLAANSTLPQVLTAMRTASWFLLTFGMGAVVARVDLWIVARFVPESGVGIYAAAQSLALILPMLGTYLSVVVSPRVLPWVKAKRLLRTTYILQGGLLLTAAGVYLLALALVPHFQPVFPRRYSQALPLVLVLLPGSLAAMISFPLTLTTLMFLQPRFLVVLDVLTVPFILAAYLFVLPRFGLTGAAWVTSSASVCRAAMAQIAALRLVRRAHLEQPVSATTACLSAYGVSTT